MSNLLTKALTTERIILSVVGPHAGESETAIFTRKRADLISCGATYWLCRSPAARPDRVKAFLSTSSSFVIFLAPAHPSGARPTTSNECVSEISPDGAYWFKPPSSLSPITGNLSKGAYALALSEISLCDGDVDLWSFLLPNEAPVKFKLGASTVLAMKGDAAENPVRMKSRVRRAVAVARTLPPHSVWVR